MIKYEVRKDAGIEAMKGETSWTADDMLNYYERESCTNLELLEAFDTKEEALKFFETEKKYCQSKYQKGSILELVIFDVLQLQENEYDEDGDFEQTLDEETYIAEI